MTELERGRPRPSIVRSKSAPAVRGISDSGPRKSTNLPKLNLLPEFAGRDVLYLPLREEKKEIRVIVLLPASERTRSLRCFLKAVSIPDARKGQEYNAISYDWGSLANTEEIIVYNRSREDPYFDSVFMVPITKNLANALRNFRAVSGPKGYAFWTDAICINQANSDERSQQVTMMRSIYTQALSVWIWLGDSDIGAERGLANLYGLAKYQQLNVFRKAPCVVEYEFEKLKLIDEALKARTTTENLVAWIASVSALSAASYWSRGWTIQEACANDIVLLHYGGTLCCLESWATLSGFLHSILGIMRELPESTSNKVSPWLFSAVVLNEWCQDHAYTEQHEQHDNTTLAIRGSMQVAYSRGQWQTSDPRDRIYALLEVMPGFRLLDLKPNYNKSVEEVFAAASIALLSASQTWSLESFLKPSRSPFLPSWALDFCLFELQTSSWLRELILSPAKGYTSDLNGKFRMRQVTPDLLLTAGTLLDEVVGVYSVHWARYDFAHHRAEFTQWFVEAMNRCQLPTKDPLWMIRQFAFKMWRFRKKTPLDVNSELVPAHDLLNMAINELLQIIEYDRLVITKRGRIGIAPRNVAIGDQIAVMSTAIVPIMLRSVEVAEAPGDAFILIGGSFIDGGSRQLLIFPHARLTLTGMMEGEAIQEEAERRYGDRNATQRVFDESDLYLV